MTEYLGNSDDSGAHDKLATVFKQLLEKAAKQKWTYQYIKYEDGSATLELGFEAKQ